MIKQILLLLLLNVPLCQAAITQVQNKTATTGATSATSLSLVLDAAPTAGNTVVCSVASGAGQYIVPNAGITWTRASTENGTGTVNNSLFIGRVFASASATITFTVTTGAGSTNWSAVCGEYSGANLKIDKMQGNDGTSTAATTGTTDTTTDPNEVFLGGITSRGTGAVTFSAPTNAYSIVGQASSSTAVSNTDRAACLLEKFVSSTQTTNAGATISVSQVFAANVITLSETPTTVTTSGSTRIPSIGY